LLAASLRERQQFNRFATFWPNDGARAPLPLAQEDALLDTPLSPPAPQFYRLLVSRNIILVHSWFSSLAV